MENVRATQYLDAVLIMNMIDGRRPGTEYLERIEKGFQLGYKYTLAGMRGLLWFTVAIVCMYGCWTIGLG